MTRPLVMTEAAVQRIRDQAAWADQPENWYWPERDPEAPGDNPAYVLMIEVGFRAVYTQTAYEGLRYRHLSVGVDGPGYPSPIAVWTIATLFGFTGGHQELDCAITSERGPDWAVEMDAATRSVMVAQCDGRAVPGPDRERTSQRRSMCMMSNEELSLAASALRDLAEALLRQREREKHGGLPCLGNRAGLIAYLAHCLGVRGVIWDLAREQLKEYDARCAGHKCDHGPGADDWVDGDGS